MIFSRTLKLIGLLVVLSVQQSPVYNVRESDPSKDPNRGLVPQLTTDYQQMIVDRTKRVITLGEPQKNAAQHVEFSPVAHYDQDVEFVSEYKPNKKRNLFLSKLCSYPQMIN